MIEKHHNPGIIEQPVQLEVMGAQEKKSSGKLKIQYYSREQRLMRALKIWGICWGGAIVSVLLPIIHFFLVPALFLTGIIAPLIVYNKESEVLRGEAVCPNCQQKLPLEGGSNKWPLEDSCSACKERIIIQKV